MAFALPVDAPTDSERTPALSTADAVRPDSVRLSWMRRWSWWSIVGLPVALGPVAAVEIVLAQPPAAVGVVAVSSALCAAVATGRLVAQRFARTDEVIEEALRRHLGEDVWDEVWRANPDPLPEDEALEGADRELDAVRTDRRRAKGG